MDQMIVPPKKIVDIINILIPKIIEYGDVFLRSVCEKKGDVYTFVNPNDPYYPFFMFQLEKIKNNTKNESQIIESKPIAPPPPPKPKAIFVPPSFNYKVPPSIGGLQLDLIHLTAQYTARYGEVFIRELLEKEGESPLFLFIKPNEQYFSFFYSLVDQYRLALEPSPLLKRRLLDEAQSILTIKDNILSEAKEYKEQLEIKKQEKIDNKQKQDQDGYEWQNFTVVGTIDLDFNQPNLIKSQPKDQLIQKPANKKKVIMQKSPITGEAIPIDQFSKHMKYETISEEYAKESEMMKERKRTHLDSLASGKEVISNLKNLSNNEIKAPENPVVWDGYEESIEKTVTMKVRQVIEEPQSVPQNKKKAPVIGPSPVIKKR